MHDAIIIGGGPAGSTAATCLARQGRRVLLLEREHFPRDHVGESLLPATLGLLELIGVLPNVQAAGFTRKDGATMRWGVDSEPWTWLFSETNQRFPHAYQVWRPAFDEILLKHSAASGAEVRFGVRVDEVLFDAPGGRAHGVRISENGEQGVLPARMIIDASGQRALLARQQQALQWDEFFRNLAVYGYFEGAARLSPPNQGNIFIEAYEHGWCWTIPLANGWSSVGCVLDRERSLPQLQALGRARMFTEQIAATRDTARLLAGAKLVKGPDVLQDWSYQASEFAGEGWLLAGDAACFIDPLFSTGVHLAVNAGYLAAAYVHTALADEALGRAAARSYTQLYRQQYQHFHRLAQLFYAGNRTAESYFWEARRITADTAFTARESFVRAVSGQASFGYERSVLAHGDLPAAFVTAVQGVSHARDERRLRVRALLASSSAERHAEPGATWFPKSASGLRVMRDAVLHADRFVWGDVIVAHGRDEPIPCSALVAELVRQADGNTSLLTLAGKLAGADSTRVAAALKSLTAATEVLYVDGLIESLGAD